MSDLISIPSDVQRDLDSGFVITDPDSHYQRCKVLGESAFQYRSGSSECGFLIDETIDVSTLCDGDKEEVIEPFYGSLEQLHDECDGDVATINMMIAECYFETYYEEQIYAPAYLDA